ncbi:hypothetical protein EST38_g342 [Candolleomyces aberdarensis]|uniref:BZIP domain-containing protein n=1 Tax=Candolleomyces aberdarensis TaxID=2316362 RepID=A0A4Q2DYW8_9AGAR|nr:hypothetical protein EST38_g342 [Candolleomyces aberdarensis]
MLISSSRFVLTVTLALSVATTGLASSSDAWSDDLEQRGYDILEAYQHVARGAFDEPEEYEAREYIADTTERRSSEEDELVARFHAVKRSIDSHGFPHDSWRGQRPFGNGRRGVRLEERDSEDELERRDLFPHDTAAISSLRKRISNRRQARKARKAAKAAAKEQEELERRARRLIEEFDGIRREEEEQLAAREFEQAKRVVLARRTLRKIINEARQLVEEEEALAAREHEEELAARNVVDEAKVEARDTTEPVVEARAPSPELSEANVIEVREPAKEEAPVAREVDSAAEAPTKRDVQDEIQTREPESPVDGEAPAAREVDTAEAPTKREVQEDDLKAREPAPAPAPEEGKPLEARSEAEVGEAVVQRSESETVLTRSEEPVADTAN